MESFLKKRYNEEETKADIDALRELVSHNALFITVFLCLYVFCNRESI